MSSPAEEYSSTFRRVRSRTRAERELPMLLPRRDDHAEISRAGACGSGRDAMEEVGLRESARRWERAPASAPDM
jgi:hypothetical protein